MGSPSEFITSFHNLEGTSLKEKNKAFHSLLVLYKNVTPDILDSILQQLTPTTYLEETFKIEFLLYFKRTTDLLNVLIKGDEVETSKIIRQNWFIKELMEKFSAVQFVKEIFPQLSVSSRTKILKRILVYIKDESKIQTLFDIIHKTYGLKVASVLISGCSDEKIKEILKDSTTFLSASKLKLLYDKNPSLITYYFDMLKNDDESVENYKWRSVFDYMAIKDPIFFSELCKKFKIYERSLGRQTTKKFVEAKRSEILDEPNKFCRFLRRDALVRKLGADFPKFFKKGLPKSVSEFNYCQVKSLLKHYSKTKQYELFYKAFKETYNKDLWENIEYMDERLIELIPNKDEREKWIKKFDNRVNYLKYQHSMSEGMARCKMMACSLTFEDDDFALCDEAAIAERKTIFNTLISTCKLNQDYEALLNILKSFTQRHRNSDVSVLYNFLRSLYKELDMKKLTEEHWKYINEIITVQLFKKQQLFYPIYVEYIRFIYLQQKPVADLVLTLLKELPHTLVDFAYDDDKFQKMMLQLYIKLLPQVDDKKNSLAVQITLSVKKWNKKHPKDIISVHEQQNIMNAFDKLKELEKSEPQMLKAFKYLICRQRETYEVSNLDEIYWGNFKNLNDKTLTKWFLKYKPELLKSHLDKVGIMLKNKNVNLIRNLKKYDHINIPEDITKLCLEELENAEPSKRERVIKILIPFMPSKEFLLFFKEHTPKVDKVDIAGGDEDARKSYEIQCALAKHLKLRIDLKEIFPDLLKYCRGDVLGSALPSLYSSFYRIPENKLYDALEELNRRAVSVRKHTIFFSTLLLPVDNVLTKFKQIETSEKHVSVKQHMFLSCYRYFLQNNLPECWPVLKNYIGELKKEQKDVTKLLANVHVVPKSHRAIFTESVWQIFNKLKKEEVKIDDNMTTLLRNLKKSDIIIMHEEFCMNIIKNKLFDLDECSMADSVFDLMKNFLLYGDQTKEKVDFIFKCLRNFKEKFWNNDEKKTEALKVVNRFCFDLFRDLLRDDTAKFNTEFPKLFSNAWKKEFTVDETFEEHLFIDFVVIKFDSGTNFDSLSQEMSKTFSNALAKYGSLIINIFKNFLSSFLRLVLKDKDYDMQVLKFLNSFIETDSSIEHCALVVDLLPESHFSEEALIIYKKLVETLLQKDQIIRIRLYGKLKSNAYDYYY